MAIAVSVVMDRGGKSESGSFGSERTLSVSSL